ncbi:hypothetical protein AB6D11_00110 [Vibrio splendidus]
MDMVSYVILIIYLSFYLFYSISVPGRAVQKAICYLVAVTAIFAIAHPDPYLIIKDPKEQILSTKVGIFLFVMGSPILLGFLLHRSIEKIQKSQQQEIDANSAMLVAQDKLHDQLHMILDLEPPIGTDLMSNIKTYFNEQLSLTDDSEEKAKIKRVLNSL